MIFYPPFSGGGGTTPIPNPLPVEITDPIQILSADSPSIDAFGRWRVSQLTTLFDLKQTHDSEPLLVSFASSSGNATHLPAESATVLSCSGVGSYSIAQTKQRFSYQSGKSHLILQTFADFTATGSTVKRIGYFSSAYTAPYDTSFDGIFLQSDSTGVSINVYRSGTLISQVYQGSWNLDTMDGLGASGININWANAQIVYLDFEYLGVGRIRYSLVIDGKIIPFHEVNNANNIAAVYMQRSNQPLRWEIRTDEVALQTFKYICATVASEGGLNQIGKLFGANIGVNWINANTSGTNYALMGIRLDITKPDTVVDVIDFSILSATTDSQLWSLYLNPTVAGTFTYLGSGNAVEIARGSTAGTNTVAGGTLLQTGYLYQLSSVSKAVENALRLGVNIDGTPDEIVLCTTPIGSNSDVFGAINWRETI